MVPESLRDGREEAPGGSGMHHPRHDAEGARRAYKRLKSGEWDWSELSARQYGLLIWHYPRLFEGWVENA